MSDRVKPLISDNENAGDDADTDDNEQDPNDDGGDFQNKKNTEDDVMEKVFQDEQKRRLDLLGDRKEM